MQAFATEDAVVDFRSGVEFVLTVWDQITLGPTALRTADLVGGGEDVTAREAIPFHDSVSLEVIERAFVSDADGDADVTFWVRTV